ncbi:MAG: acetylxylan esterase [Bacteroidales bacterium]|nr:acetylxylan esterase [Bacteroidales bacterium]
MNLKQNLVALPLTALLLLSSAVATAQAPQAPQGPRPQGPMGPMGPMGGPNGAPAFNMPPRQAEIIPGRTPTSPKLDAYFVESTFDAVKPDNDGFIGSWMLLEPISKPTRTNAIFIDSYLRETFNTKFFPRQLANTLKELPKAGQTEKIDGKKLKWHALDSKLYNVKLFRFAACNQLEVYGVLFWAYTVINCPEDMNDVRLAVGSNSASMWWVNGKEAVLLSGDRRMVRDDCISPRLNLKKGQNIIWGAVINGPGMSDFCVRFIDAKGNPIKNITISNKLK